MISDSDAKHLECVERAAFQPIGWLYQGIFERLLERGLVDITVSYAYIISDYGAAQLEAFRLEGLRRLAEHNVEKSMSNRTHTARVLLGTDSRWRIRLGGAEQPRLVEGDRDEGGVQCHSGISPRG